jgi:hypothetical protein
MRRRALILSAVLAASITPLVPVPALAGARSPAAGSSVAVFSDPAGDLTGGTDLTRIRVSNGDRLRVTLRQRDLRRKDFDSSFTLFVDTSTAHPGPDFGMAGGLSDASDWHTGRATRHWHVRGNPLGPIGTCDSRLRIDWRANVVRISLGRDCLGGHQGRVRVAVVTGDATGRDFAPAERTFFRWLPRG